MTTPSFGEGARAVFDGLGVLGRDGPQRRRAIIPVVLTVALYVLALASVAWAADPLLGLLWSEPEATWTVSRVLWLLLRWGLSAALFVALCFVFTAVLEVVAGPFFDAMAGHELQRAGLKTTDTGLVDGGLLEGARALVMALPLILFSVAALIPALTGPASVLGTAWAWFGLGTGAVNPSLVQSGLKMGRRLAFGVQCFPFVMGVGAVTGLLLFVPLLGWFSLPAAVVGSARVWSRHARGWSRPSEERA